MGCPLASWVSVGLRSPGSHFSQHKVGISFCWSEWEAKEKHLWNLTSACGSLSGRWPARQRYVIMLDASPASAFFTELCHSAVLCWFSFVAHDLVEDCFSAEVSAELSACRCCPLSPPELDSTGQSPYRKPTLEQLCREGLHPLGAQELLNLIFHSFPSKERRSERAAGWVSSSWPRSTCHVRL